MKSLQWEVIAESKMVQVQLETFLICMHRLQLIKIWRFLLASRCFLFNWNLHFSQNNTKKILTLDRFSLVEAERTLKEWELYELSHSLHEVTALCYNMTQQTLRSFKSSSLRDNHSLSVVINEITMVLTIKDLGPECPPSFPYNCFELISGNNNCVNSSLWSDLSPSIFQVGAVIHKQVCALILLFCPHFRKRSAPHLTLCRFCFPEFIVFMAVAGTAEGTGTWRGDER